MISYTKFSARHSHHMLYVLGRVPNMQRAPTREDPRVKSGCIQMTAHMWQGDVPCHRLLSAVPRTSSELEWICLWRRDMNLLRKTLILPTKSLENTENCKEENKNKSPIIAIPCLSVCVRMWMCVFNIIETILCMISWNYFFSGYFVGYAFHQLMNMLHKQSFNRLFHNNIIIFSLCWPFR